jgi:hypothetical protein
MTTVPTADARHPEELAIGASLAQARPRVKVFLSSRVVLVANPSDQWTLTAIQGLNDLGFRCVCVRRFDLGLELLRRGGAISVIVAVPVTLSHVALVQRFAALAHGGEVVICPPTPVDADVRASLERASVRIIAHAAPSDVVACLARIRLQLLPC